MITIVDYNAGNLKSVERACHAVGISAELTQDPEAIFKADKIIFPGVGNARSAMDTLKKTGIADAIKAAFIKGTPILGICLGAQIILDHSEEGDITTLGLIAGRTRRIVVQRSDLKIPHMGWNEVRVEQPHPLLNGIQSGDEFYFVHAYYPEPFDPSDVFASTDHGMRFCCALGKENLLATQFHPEKSGRLGLALLNSFADWKGSSC